MFIMLMQVYRKKDSRGTKQCADSLQVKDIWALSYGCRPKEWTDNEVKAKQRTKKQYEFLSSAQRKFMDEKPLRLSRNGKQSDMKRAHSKTAMWLAGEVKLDAVKEFQCQAERFQDENGTCTQIKHHGGKSNSRNYSYSY